MFKRRQIQVRDIKKALEILKKRPLVPLKIK